MIDYKYIIDNLENERVKQLLYQLGADQVEEKDNCFITNTICHNIEGGSLKLYYYFDTHIFYCYTNCESMSIFKFLEHYYKTRQIDYDWYNDIYQVIIKCSINNEHEYFNIKPYISLKDKYEKIEKPKLPIYSSGILNVFEHIYPIEWLNDGISKKAMDKFNILYSISQNKIIIPHYDINGNLIGIRGRALNTWEIENLGKYMPVKIEQTWYKHPLSLNLYGLNFNKENIKKYGYVYIFEAEKSILQLENFSQPNCGVAVCGSNFNKFQLKLLIQYCHPKEIILCFDKEEKQGENKYFTKLWNIGKKYQNYCDFSFVYDNENLLEMKDSPSDRGEEIFNKLIRKRVKIK